MPTLPLFESTADPSHILPAFRLRCFVAVLCGGIIGIEREPKKKPARFRTNVLPRRS